ncbi:MAG: histidinol dehydrogenase [Solirubrobacterales bacterium]
MPVKRFPSDVTAAEIRSLSPDMPVEAVAAILRDVKSGGDHAVLEFEHRFGGAATPEDGAKLRPVDREFIAAALDEIDSELRAALELAIANVRQVAETQVTNDQTVSLAQGQSIEYLSTPVKRAAAYIPGGRGSYPSTAVMCLVSAHAAGVESIVAVSPAREHGEVDSAVAAVCGLLGVTELYAIGGAQAIAALAYGTETIAPVDVIVGPGNSYVQEAKRQLVGRVGIDGVAGPSELVVVADSTADSEAIALDLLAQGEHGPDSLVVLISPDPELIDAVIERAKSIEAEMAVVLAHDLDSGVALADALAPEHMQIAAADSELERLASGVTRAGCLFVGHNAATAFGDYVVGSNHVLPTGGAARYASALSVSTFRRRMSRVTIPDAAVGPLARAGARIADAEGFPLHGRSMEARNK